jgi:lipopolysaccharide biosynthesis protein
MKIIRSLDLKSELSYRNNLKDLHLRLKHRNKKVKLAVIIHLFYVDNWELFNQKLSNLDGIEYDIFVTMPESNKYFVDEIFKTHPSATFIYVPNRGRDVLPFVKVAKVLIEHGYEYVLKFHSKRSTHWEGGQDWLESMLEQLLPESSVLIDRIQHILDQTETGIIGPSREYYPLTINFPANGPHMTRIVKKIYNEKVANDVLQQRRSEYGFFAGTMFWARLDAIEPLLRYTKTRFFEKEKGQIDATYAHALERMFCIVPEIEHKNMYVLNDSGIQSRKYKSDNIPLWSTDHNK